MLSNDCGFIENLKSEAIEPYAAAVIPSESEGPLFDDDFVG